jgi:hypothetical protein
MTLPRRRLPSFARRLVTVALASAACLALTAAPASATYDCWMEVDGHRLDYPCPSPGDQPVGAPVWVATDYGPGYGQPEWSFIKVTKGARVFIANVTSLHGDYIRFHGAGFDSGLVPVGQAREVIGVPQLPVGGYAIYSAYGEYAGDLWIVESPIGVCC